MSKSILVIAVAAVWVFFATSVETEAAQQSYHCGLLQCTCTGKADCLELLATDWCTQKLCCGSKCGLPFGKCKCDTLYKQGGATKRGGAKPQVQTR